MLKRYLILLAVFCVVSVPTAASAQAWIAEPGTGYLEMTGRTLSGSSYYGSDGQSRPLASEFTQRTLNLYGEVGLVERWLQVTLTGEVFRRNELANQGATAGMGDLRVGAWSGLLQGKLNVSAGLLVGLPTGDASPQAPGDDPQTDIVAASLPTGDGEFDFTPTLAAGFGFGGTSWPLRHYLSTSAGYQIRTRGFQDAFEWRAELGTRIPVTVLDRVWFIARLSGLHPVGDTAQTSFSGFGNGVEYVSPGFGISIDLWKGAGLTASVETAVQAKNIISGTPFQAGLFYDF